MDDCTFCKIARREIPSNIVFEDTHSVVVPDLKPIAEVHVLVIPKYHYANLHKALLEGGSSLLFQTFVTVTNYAKEHLPNGFRTIINTGSDAGQTMMHLHVHILGGEKLKDL